MLVAGALAGLSALTAALAITPRAAARTSA
jgi:hypothetical protein